MYFVENETNETYEEKKSKFIAYLTSYLKFEDLMIELRKQHPKARHFVYAYRYLNEYDQIVENCSDDGEPKGTSGKPSLAVLAGNELINSAVIIVRYFGGVKLGTGGLVRAYGDAVNLVIRNAKLKEYQKLEEYFFEVEYSKLSKIEYILENLNINIIEKKFDSLVTLKISLPSSLFENLKTQLPREIIFIRNI